MGLPPCWRGRRANTIGKCYAGWLLCKGCCTKKEQKESPRPILRMFLIFLRTCCMKKAWRLQRSRTSQLRVITNCTSPAPRRWWRAAVLAMPRPWLLVQLTPPAPLTGKNINSWGLHENKLIMVLLRDTGQHQDLSVPFRYGGTA